MPQQIRPFDTLIIGLDANGNVCYCNEKAERLTEYHRNVISEGAWSHQAAAQVNHPEAGEKRQVFWEYADFQQNSGQPVQKLLVGLDFGKQSIEEPSLDTPEPFGPMSAVSTSAPEDGKAAETEDALLKKELRQALERNEFVLHYQPQMDTATGQISGVEALIRWIHPKRGLIPPVNFLPQAETTDLIYEISIWTLKTACAQLRDWKNAGLPAIRVSVNLSIAYFQLPDLAEKINQILLESNIEAHYLELEITENFLTQRHANTVSTLKSLRNSGIQLSVDDFGVGFSNLHCLKLKLISTLKIDHAFVQGVTTNPEDATFAKAVIALAHSLSLRVVAEGVETEGQLVFFAEQGCDEIQGYYLSKPLPPGECTQFLQQHQPKSAIVKSAAPRSLLLVDDEVNVINALKRLLRKDGYLILTAESGMAALQILATHQVGVIISDQRMPEMTGVEFLRRVRELYPDTIRIVLSGYADIQSITNAINEGAIYKFLSKPWEDEQVREQVRQAFLNFELKQENTRLKQEVERYNLELLEINHELEKRVAEKTDDICNSLTVLQISQEILDHLPVAVIGIDEDDLIVLANRMAERLFYVASNTGLLGCEARSRLPCTVTGCRDMADGIEHPILLNDGRKMKIICRNMDPSCRSKGTLLMISPFENG